MEREQLIIRTIANVFEVDETFATNGSMKRKHVFPRKVLISVLTRYGKMSVKKASMFCGYKSHATAILHLKDISTLCFQFDSFDLQYKTVCDEAEKVYKTTGDEGTSCVAS